MKKELQEAIFAGFPEFFPAELRTDPVVSCMYWGLEVGDGWYDLLWKLCEDLEKAGFTGKVVQVKEKFGGLRFYTEGETEDQWDMINRAENRSLEICDVCGKDGYAGGRGWITTRCEEHRDK